VEQRLARNGNTNVKMIKRIETGWNKRLIRMRSKIQMEEMKNKIRTV